MRKTDYKLAIALTLTLWLGVRGFVLGQEIDSDLTTSPVVVTYDDTLKQFKSLVNRYLDSTPELTPITFNQNPEYCITIDASASIDSANSELIYEWIHHREEVERTKVLKVCYDQPGKHMIWLNVIDPTTGIRNLRDTAIELYLEPKPNFDTEGLALINTTQSFDVSTYANEVSQRTFLWDFGDGTMRQGKVVRHVFHEAGEFPIRLFEIEMGEGQMKIMKAYESSMVIKR